MTGGLAVVLGPTGRNFGAGMTNGLAYVLDVDGTLDGQINHDSVLLERIADDDDISDVREAIAACSADAQPARTEVARELGTSTLTKMWKVIPRATLLFAVAEPDEVEAKGAAD